MKYLVLIAVLAIAFFLWRNARRDAMPRPGARPAAPGRPQDMVQCPVCSVHLPRADALPGPDGALYCCRDHASRA